MEWDLKREGLVEKMGVLFACKSWLVDESGEERFFGV